METIRNSRFQETYCEETLENGLKVIIWQTPGFNKSFFLMGTPLGGLDLKQEDEDGKYYEFPAGIAHFLEHKMFEKGNMDVMDEFSAMGANVNAFTSYSETAYYFSTTQDPIKPLNLLLDFVQELDISETSVEKEKGIIVQELEMYQQMSEVRIINETLQSIYSKHPLVHDIGGDNESVKGITKQQLDTCYKLNYHPSKMILVCVTSYDCHTLMNEIKQNQTKKIFPEVSKVNRFNQEEPYEVNRKEHSIKMDINVPKVNLSFKLKGIEDSVVRNKKEWTYKILLDMYYTSLNPEFQNWIDNEWINTSFSFETDFGRDYGLLMFYSECEKSDEFKNVIINTFKNITEIDDKLLKQLKNRYFGMSINALQNQKQVAITCMRNYFAGLDFFESIEVIESITKEDVLEALHEIDLENNVKVTIMPLSA